MPCTNLKPYICNLDAITEGDTYPGFNIEGIGDSSGETLARVRLQMRNAAGDVVLNLDSDATGIVINDPETWDFDVQDFTAPPASVNQYSIQTTTTTGNKYTIVAGILTTNPRAIS